MGKTLTSGDKLILAQNLMNRALLILDSSGMQLPAIHLETAISFLQMEMMTAGLDQPNQTGDESQSPNTFEARVDGQQGSNFKDLLK